MDISKICIETTPENPSYSTPAEQRDTLPPINGSSRSDRPQNQPQNQLQHSYIESYDREHHQQETPKLDYPTSDHADQHSFMSSYHTNSIPPMLTSQRPIAPQPASSSASLKGSYQQHQSSPISSPLPPSSPTSQTFEHTQHSKAFNNHHNTSNLMKHILEQCTSIYQKIGKYRTDPLRESERNQIIDSAFYTTKDLLKSLNILSKQMNDSAANSAALDNHNNDSNIQMDCKNENDLAPGNESTMEDYKMIRQARNLQRNIRPKYRRRSRTSMVGHRCHSCNTTDTPEWRRGPDGARTLCNACGLHYSKLLRKGSLTVQTHNYLIETHPESSTTRPQPRAIRFPIIQVNNTTINNNSDDHNSTTNKNPAVHSIPEPANITKTFFSKYSTSAQIIELDEEDQKKF